MSDLGDMYVAYLAGVILKVAVVAILVIGGAFALGYYMGHS